VFDAIQAAIAAGEPIGWRVLDPEGNVVEEGGLSFAELISDSPEPDQEG